MLVRARAYATETMQPQRAVLVCLIALLGAAAAGPCTAQSFSPATDVDLSAAYCIGVVKIQIPGMNNVRANLSTNDVRASLSGSNDPLAAYATPLVDQELGDLRDRLHRLQAYVIPKIGHLDPVSLAVASARGEGGRHGINISPASAANSERQRPTVDERLQCVQAKVKEGEPWQRTQRCKQLDFRALRPDADVRAALRHLAAGAKGRRARRHGERGRFQRGLGQRLRSARRPDRAAGRHILRRSASPSAPANVVRSSARVKVVVA